MMIHQEFTRGGERRRAKFERLLAKGRTISAALMADAAAARLRLAAIDREYPEDDTG